MGLMYQEVCNFYITRSIIKDMKIEPRNKWKKKKKKKEKLKHWSSTLVSIYWDLMKNSRHKLDTSWSMELTDFRI